MEVYDIQEMIVLTSRQENTRQDVHWKLPLFWEFKVYVDILLVSQSLSKKKKQKKEKKKMKRRRRRIRRRRRRIIIISLFASPEADRSVSESMEQGCKNNIAN